MFNLDRLRDYRTQPRNLRLVVTGAAWAVYVSPAATVLDVALVMNSMCCDLDATPAKLAQGFFLRPRDPDVPAPTHEEFVAILERGFPQGEQLPRLVARSV